MGKEDMSFFTEGKGDKKYQVEIICSVCGKVMGTKESVLNAPTHSYCPQCLAKEKAKYGLGPK